jgi:hypothetical protein
MKPKEKSFFNQAQYHEAFTKRVLKKKIRIEKKVLKTRDPIHRSQKT